MIRLNAAPAMVDSPTRHTPAWPVLQALRPPAFAHRTRSSRSSGSMRWSESEVLEALQETDSVAALLSEVLSPEV